MLKYLKYFFGVLFLVLAVFTVFDYFRNDHVYTALALVNGITLTGLGLYLLFFNRKKTIVLLHDRLFIYRGEKQIKTIDLQEEERMVKAFGSIKFFLNDKTITLHYREFEDSSIDILSSLH